jgi:hypothetical protein
MRRTVILVILCAALATAVASADDQTISPEAHWTITHLTPPQVSSPSPHRRGRGWSWDDIDRHPARSMGGD